MPQASLEPSTAPAQLTQRLHPLDVADALALPAKLQWTLVARYRHDGEFDEAAHLLDAIEARSGETGTLLEERARLAFAQEDFAEAESLLKQRVDRAPSATSRVALARLYLETGDLEQAQAIGEDLAQSDGGLQTVAGLNADIARATGDIEAARAFHRRTLEERGGNVHALLAMASLDLEDGDAAAAQIHLDLAVDALEGGGSVLQMATAAQIALEIGDSNRAATLEARSREADSERLEALREEIARHLGIGYERAPADRPVSPAPRPASMAAMPTPPGGSVSLQTPTERPRSSPEPRKARVAVEVHELVEEPVHDEPDLEGQFPGTLTALKTLFGFDGLRPGQAAVIANVLSKRDTLATMPTGAGKSLTFQLPAMVQDGVTLVISPLIALMKDQVETLPAPVRAKTVLINSTLSMDEMRRALADVEAGGVKLVYAAPERLRQHSFLRALRTAGVALVVIDEAHCISLWGHDFRPDYLSIPKALPELGQPPVLAITATATPAMAQQIGAGLGRDLARIRVSLFRKNLFYEAHRCTNREDKVRRLVQICQEQKQKNAGCGIVYVGSRKDAEQLAGLLRDRGIAALPYHAGLDPTVRATNQDRFMAGDRNSQVMVATVAFGMGVNKADVRFIVHLSPSRSLEAYAQESGRAGRDGMPARCILLYSATDQANLTRQAARDALELDDLRAVYARVKRAAWGRWAIVDPAEIMPPVGQDDDPDDVIDVRVAIGVLEQGGLIIRHPDAPASRTLRPAFGGTTFGLAGSAPLSEADATTWTRIKDGLLADEQEDDQLTFRTAVACNTYDLSPTDLERILEGQTEFRVRDERRLVCLELLPADQQSGERLREVLERARIESQRRITLMMAYANGGRCRHAVMAAHLGERLSPCETSCDDCTGETDATANQAVYRSRTTAADARIVLETVRTLPFPMGKTGITKILAGSVESRVRSDRTPTFGKLKDLSKGRIDGLIDSLIADGFLNRDMEHEYKIITLTSLGSAASDDDLSGYEQQSSISPSAGTAGRSRSKATEADEIQLDSAGEALLGRLQAWRSQRASLDGMPPYVIAHNKDLMALAAIRPSSEAALANVPGFGPSRVAKYGEEILALIAAADD